MCKVNLFPAESISNCISNETRTMNCKWTLAQRHTNMYIHTHTHSLFGSIKPWGLRIPSGIIVFADKSLRIRVQAIKRHMYVYPYIYIRPSTGSCQQSELCLSLNDPQLRDHRSMLNERWFAWFDM